MFSLEQFPLVFEAEHFEPYMSRDTINFHYGKHLATYIKNLNDLIAGTGYEKMRLGEIIVKSAESAADKKIFNNAAQVFNHDFFFRGLARDNGSDVPADVADAFGGRDKFLAEFKNAALSVFGSGWTWLVIENGKPKIITTANADTPVAHGIKPALTLDVWEHAYYLDYQNRRGDFIDAFLGHLVNWKMVEENMI